MKKKWIKWLKYLSITLSLMLAIKDIADLAIEEDKRKDVR